MLFILITESSGSLLNAVPKETASTTLPYSALLRDGERDLLFNSFPRNPRCHWLGWITGPDPLSWCSQASKESRRRGLAVESSPKALLAIHTPAGRKAGKNGTLSVAVSGTWVLLFSKQMSTASCSVFVPVPNQMVKYVISRWLCKYKFMPRSHACVKQKNRNMKYPHGVHPEIELNQARQI